MDPFHELGLGARPRSGAAKRVPAMNMRVVLHSGRLGSMKLEAGLVHP